MHGYSLLAILIFAAKRIATMIKCINRVISSTGRLAFAVSLLSIGLQGGTPSVANTIWNPFGKKKPVADTLTKSKDKEESKLKSFEKVITSKAVSDSGLFTIHRVSEDYFFEIPKAFLGRDFLVVNKISKVPAALNDAGVNKGMNSENIVVRFEYDTLRQCILIRQIRPFVEVNPADAIAQSVDNNYISSVAEKLDVAALSKDSLKLVVKINKLYDGKSTSINNIFGMLGLGTTPNSELSKILSVKSFPGNILVKAEQTTSIPGAETYSYLTIEVTSSMVLLPEKPMVPRFADDRVGLFTVPRSYFSDKQHKLEARDLVTRWKLEPKPEDRERYFRGELVEPVKPIVFYVDPSTPIQWREYIRKGIEDWQVAFEAAGFKNAIIGKYAADSSDFDVDDVRYSVITYAASAKANAMGPSVCDPRSGEILEADVIWWHNVMTTLTSWLRVQTGPVDSATRGNRHSEEVMGNAIRFVSCHEIGHSLGLKHNMGASNAYPVDSLRSPAFTERMGGTAPSIMDYARFNYVAQPGDGVKKLTPNIGVYDKYAIAWAYRYLGTENPHAEKDTLNKWIVAHDGDPLYWYGEQQDSREAIDPRSLSEDIGDDAIKAATYGVANLKRIMPNIEKWTYEKGESYYEAGKLLTDIINQWNTYSYHVLPNVGGIYIENSVYGSNKPTYTFVESEKQRAAVKYLINEVLTYPKWLFGSSVYNKTYPVYDTPNGQMEYSPAMMLKNYHSFILWDLTKDERLSRMLENEIRNGNKVYKANDMLNDLYKAIFAKTIKGESLSVLERELQKNFVDVLLIASDQNAASKTKKTLHDDAFAAFTGNAILPCMDQCCAQGSERSAKQLIFTGSLSARVSDVISLKRGTLLKVRDTLKSHVSVADEPTRFHYQDLILRIENALINK